MKKVICCLLAVLCIGEASCATAVKPRPATLAADLVETSRLMSSQVNTAQDAEQISSILIEHYLGQATRSRDRRRNGDLAALFLSTGSLVALGLNWGGDFAVATGLGGNALRQYIAIEQPRGPTPSMTSVNQTACVIAQLPALIDYETSAPPETRRQRSAQLERSYNSALSAVRNALWVIYANNQAATGDFTMRPNKLVLVESDYDSGDDDDLSADELNQLGVRIAGAQSQLPLCTRMFANTAY